MKTVTFWISVQGDFPTDLLVGDAAYNRRTIIRVAEASYPGGWQQAKKHGWRVRKVTIPWEQVKP